MEFNSGDCGGGRTAVRVRDLDLPTHNTRKGSDWKLGVMVLRDRARGVLRRQHSKPTTVQREADGDCRYPVYVVTCFVGVVGRPTSRGKIVQI